MAFIPRKNVSDLDYKFAVIANSGTLKIGDAIIPDATNKAAVLTAANTTGIVLGVVTGIFQNSAVLEKSSVTVASNNETVGKIYVQYIPAYLPIEYTATLDATAGTTTDSDKMAQFNVTTTDGGLLLESSVGVFSTQKQFFSFGLLPNETTKVVGKFSTTKTL